MTGSVWTLTWLPHHRITVKVKSELRRILPMTKTWEKNQLYVGSPTLGAGQGQPLPFPRRAQPTGPDTTARQKDRAGRRTASYVLNPQVAAKAAIHLAEALFART